MVIKKVSKMPSFISLGSAQAFECLITFCNVSKFQKLHFLRYYLNITILYQFFACIYPSCFLHGNKATQLQVENGTRLGPTVALAGIPKRGLRLRVGAGSTGSPCQCSRHQFTV